METIRARIDIDALDAKISIDELLAAVNRGAAVSLGEDSNVAYGRLYNFYTVDTGLLAPVGYRVATDADLTQLTTYIDIEYNNHPNDFGVANHLKSCRQISSPLGGGCSTSEHPRWNTNATHYGRDTVAFMGLPGGYRNNDGSFVYIGDRLYMWGSKFGSAAWYLRLRSDANSTHQSDINVSYGLSVRCLRDAAGEEVNEIDGTIIEKIEDIDGNIYDGVKIGDQIWFGQSLAVTKLNDGTAIANLTDATAWAGTTDPAYCDYDNDVNYTFYNVPAVDEYLLLETGDFILLENNSKIILE